jgi:polysaccharide biosynthesis transport protein
MEVSAPSGPSSAESFTYALGVVRRQIFVVLVFALLGAGLGVVIFLKAAPIYAATATLWLDTHKIDVLQQPAVSSEMPIGAMGMMESQIELLKSDEVALSVIKKLKLWEDPSFVGDEKPSIVTRLISRFVSEQIPLTEADRKEEALRLFKKSLTVDRVGAAYAIEIGFVSRDPDLAAEVANEVAYAYNDLRQTSESDAARQASDWLENRIPELRTKSEAAQRAVVEYKTDHNIVDTGSGNLIQDQRVADLSAKLNATRDETLKAKTRLDLLAAAGGVEELGALGDAATSKDDKNDTLATLRHDYFEVTAKEAELSSKLGPNNPTIVSLRNQKVQLRSEMQDELQRLKQSSKSDYDIARSRESEVKREFDAAVLQSQAGNQARVKLQELEASARAYQDLYNTFLSRYNASLQQAVSPVVGANVITPATPPAEKDYKKIFKVAALFPVAGLALGLGVALTQEFLAGRVFRTSKSIQSRLGMACVGVLPKVEHPRRSKWLRRSQGDAPPGTLVRGDRGVSWTVVDYPLSRFSEGVRSIKMAIDIYYDERRSRSGRIVGFTSAIPGEGKSTVALAVGQLIARNGASVIVVDCDLRNPSLTRSVAAKADKGIIELVAGQASLEDIVWTDPSTQMAFLPAVPRPGPPDSATILASAELKQIFEKLQASYKFVIVDLSPIAPVIDVCATTELIDSYVLVIEWGSTTIDVVEHALRAAPNINESIIGAALNKANIRELARYDPYLSGYYYAKRSNRYQPTDI